MVKKMKTPRYQITNKAMVAKAVVTPKSEAERMIVEVYAAKVGYKRRVVVYFGKKRV